MAIRDKITNKNYERSLTQLPHNLQKYISLTLLRTLEKLCKKRNHGMVDLQPILTKILKQDSSRHQVWNIDKLYTRRNMCIKKEKKQHMWDKGEEDIHYHHHHHHIYIKEYNVCKRGHKNMVYEVRKATTKPHYIPQSSLPYLVYPMLALFLN